MVGIGLVAFYCNLFKPNTVVTNEENKNIKEELVEEEDQVHHLRRKSLRRASLQLPRIIVSDQLVSPECNWNESLFHTPQPYKTPSPPVTNSPLLIDSNK